MKTKKVNLSILILSSLIILSFAFFVVAKENNQTNNNIFLDSDQDGLTNQEEKLYGTDPYNPDTDGDGYSDGAEVKAGYNPLKPAPGDKLLNNQKKWAEKNLVKNKSGQNNLTSEVAQKIANLSNQSKAGNQEVTLAQIQKIVDSSLAINDKKSIDLPTIPLSEIKIKKQDYKNLSSSKAQKKRKEDFTNYVAAVFYILTSNSPQPITSFTDISSVINQSVQQIIMALSSGDQNSLNNISKSGQKILSQLKEVEVPKEMVNTHIKALEYATYSEQLKGLIKNNSQDPIMGIANYAKIGSFVNNLISFSDDIQNKFKKYNMDYSDIQNKMKKYGVDIKYNKTNK